VSSNSFHGNVLAKSPKVLMSSSGNLGNLQTYNSHWARNSSFWRSRPSHFSGPLVSSLPWRIFNRFSPV